jgi:AcrR family transcriptional regulator
MDEVKASSPRGRPRSLEVDRAILTTALRHLAERGYGGMSIEGVAAEAGVGKTAIYRRFPQKIGLVSAAVSSLMADVGQLPDTGDTLSDLREFLRQNHQAFVNSPIYPMVGTLLVEERRNPELFQIFREKAIHPRRAQLRMILEQGIQHGDIRPDVDLDVAMETLVGALYARHIAGLPETAEWLEGVVDVVWHGLDYSGGQHPGPGTQSPAPPFHQEIGE